MGHTLPPTSPNPTVKKPPGATPDRIFRGGMVPLIREVGPNSKAEFAPCGPGASAYNSGANGPDTIRLSRLSNYHLYHRPHQAHALCSLRRIMLEPKSFHGLDARLKVRQPGRMCRGPCPTAGRCSTRTADTQPDHRGPLKRAHIAD